MREKRSSRLSAFAVLMVACAMGGCTTHIRYEKGEVLRTERQVVESGTSYRLAFREELDAAPPALAVWVEAVRTVTEERRPIHAKREVYLAGRWLFEPGFFLWPVNLVRTPLGLAGCGFSALSVGAHWGAAAVGVVFAIPATAVTPILSGSGGQMNLMRTGGAFTLVGVAIVETVLLVIDLPHKAVHGTPLYPVTRNRPDFPEAWGRAIKGSWAFAWDYKVYPPFFMRRKSTVRHRDVPGEEVPGQWTRAEYAEEPEVADVGSFVFEGRGWRRTVEAADGECRINLLAVVQASGAVRTLTFTVKAATPGQPVSQQFEYQVSTLLQPGVE